MSEPEEIGFDWRTWLRKLCAKLGTPIENQSSEIADIGISVGLSVDKLLAKHRPENGHSLEAFEVGWRLKQFVTSSHCYDGRDLARFFGCDGLPEWVRDAGGTPSYETYVSYRIGRVQMTSQRQC